MSFLNFIKSNIDEKYINLINGKTENIVQGFSVDEIDKFMEIYKKFTFRITSEHRKLEDAFIEIKAREETRIAEENKRKKEEERRRKKEMQEEKRKHEAFVYAMQIKRDKFERVFQTIVLFCPVILGIIFAIIMFANLPRFQEKFADIVTTWGCSFFVILIATICFNEKMHNEWKTHGILSRVVASVYAVLTIVILIIIISFLH